MARPKGKATKKRADTGKRRPGSAHEKMNIREISQEIQQIAAMVIRDYGNKFATDKTKINAQDFDTMRFFVEHVLQLRKLILEKKKINLSKEEDDRCKALTGKSASELAAQIRAEKIYAQDKC